MIRLVARTYQHATRVAKRWTVEAPARRFVSFCRQRWPQRDSSTRDSVVLVGLFASYPLIFCYGYVMNHLAEMHGSRIESYQFLGSVHPLINRLFEAFGARFGLSMADAAPHESCVQAQAAEIYPGLKTKWDVVKITVDGVLIGDQIYDSYLRFHNEPTVRLEDPRLRELLVQALRVFYATRDYLARNRVTAFITDDFSYINSGIITRLMFLAKVPCYAVLFGEPFSLMRCDPEPSGAGHQYPPPVIYPFYAFPSLFKKLPEQERADGIEKARLALEERFAGKFDPLVKMHETTYAVSNERALDDGPEPRILVMLHDFVDSPHGYRDMLFPDFIEWLNFLLERAAKTPFRWYLKPHPCTVDPSRAAMNLANDKAVADLKQRFPWVSILPAETSNKQILDDGVAAMFTVHGTAGHEYAYHGVPVVHCGDNPHIAYDFNIRAKTLKEYEHYILNADRLQVQIDKRAIEEFFFMNYFHHAQVHGSRVNPIDERIFAKPDCETRINRLEAFNEFVAGATPERERGVTAYLTRYFSQPS